jgi:hypothetical protein
MPRILTGGRTAVARGSFRFLSGFNWGSGHLVDCYGWLPGLPKIQLRERERERVWSLLAIQDLSLRCKTTWKAPRAAQTQTRTQTQAQAQAQTQTQAQAQAQTQTQAHSQNLFTVYYYDNRTRKS